MLTFQLYLDRATRYRWRLLHDGSENIADSGQGYDEKAQAVVDIEQVRRYAPTAAWVDLENGDSSPANAPRFEYYESRGGRYRWRLRSPSGEIISDSTTGYAGREDVRRVLALVRDGAAAALLDDQTAPPTPPPYELDPLPNGFSINWPVPPTLNQEIEITSPPAGGMLRLEQSETQYRIRVGFDQLIIAASDIAVTVDAGVAIGRAFVAREQRRIRIEGGEYRQIELQIPVDFNTAPDDFREEWLVEDVLIDGVRVVNVESEEINGAFALRGKRIAVLRSQARAHRYSVWVGDTADFQSEDIILAGNDFRSAGPEATVRLVAVHRSATAGNRLENPQKHNYRVHGRSDQAFAARNLLLQAGLMIAQMPEDDIGTVWFVDNVIDHRTPSLLVADQPLASRLRRFVATGNIAFSTQWDCFLCMDVPPGWTVEGNRVLRVANSS